MYTVLLILHFVGLALGLGSSFALWTLRRGSSSLPPAERLAFMGKVAAVAKNGSIGLLLLILSGVGLVVKLGGMTLFKTLGGAFHLKIALVLVLCGIVGMAQVTMKRVREGGGPAAAARLPMLGDAGLLVSLIIVVLAVVTFH